VSFDDHVKGDMDPEKLQNFSEPDHATTSSPERDRDSNRSDLAPGACCDSRPASFSRRGGHPPICGILASAITFFHLATSALM
jgi:hypothetical protein